MLSLLEQQSLLCEWERRNIAAVKTGKPLVITEHGYDSGLPYKVWAEISGELSRLNYLRQSVRPITQDDVKEVFKEHTKMVLFSFKHVMSTKNEAIARSVALENRCHYALCVFDGRLYVGETAELSKFSATAYTPDGTEVAIR